MLARVANNLFWMGRYIERAEHTARFLHVNYFSSLDAPNKISQSRQFVLNSIMRMVGVPIEEDLELDEKEVLYNVGLNPDKNYSILYNIRAARENAHSARDLISTEIYETINKFYHFISNYSREVYVKSGLYDFAVTSTDSCAVCRGKIRGTLLHDEVYALIMLGANLERATQITRIIKTKHMDAFKSTGSYNNPVYNSFEWTTLLKCCESYDMMRRFYKKAPTSLNTLEFLMLNPNCPRSVMNSLNQSFKHINELDVGKINDKNSAAFLVGKMRSEYQYMRIDEIEADITAFIKNTLDMLVEIGIKLEREYFNY